MNNISVFEKDFLHEIDNIAMKQTIHSEPLSTLKDILLNKSITRLRELGRIHKIRRYTKMDKFELADCIVNEISNIEYLQELLMMVHSDMFKEFCIAVKTPQYICTSVACVKLDFLKNLGLAELYYFNDSFIAVIPTEIKDSFDSLVSTGFIDKKKRSDLIDDYASAAVNLYGVISQYDFVELFNSQNKKKTNLDEVFQTLIPHIMIQSNYCFWDKYLVYASFEDDDFEDVKHLLNQIGNKPRYIPAKQELLKYTDGEYYEETPQTKELFRYLKSISNDPAQAEDITHELCLACVNEADISDLFNILNENDIKLENISQAQKMTELLTAVSNNTRLWVNNGHTPNELYRNYSAPNLFPMQPQIKNVIIG